VPQEQVAYQGFATNQEFIRKYIPRANAQAALADEFLELFAFLGADLKVILQYDGLSVEIKMGSGWISLQEIEQSIQ